MLMLVYVEFRVYLFYYTSHLRIGPSDPFYHISLYSSRLCLDSKCFKVRECFEFGIYTVEVLVKYNGKCGSWSLSFAVICHHCFVAWSRRR